MLPDADDPPSGSSEATEISCVSLPCRLDLGLPGLGHLVAPSRETPAVPEVAIDEHGKALFPKYKVRTARQIGCMGFPREAGLGQQRRKLAFRAGALAPYASHDPAARLD